MTREAAEEILELPRRYTREDVRRAYTDLARRYHPDAASRHHFDPAVAQARMVEANKAHDVLRREFVGEPDRVISREWGGIAQGYANVDWRAGASADVAADPWGFADDWGAEAAVREKPSGLRAFLLGPVVPRVLLLAALGVLWVRVFPLLGNNMERYAPAAGWTMAHVARLVAAMVYPTYAFVYELLSGHLSDLLREIANGAVSWVTRRYMDLRPKGASYGCALYKLLREQVYALLMLPLELFAIAALTTAPDSAQGLLWVVVVIALGIDTLAACTRGGFVNVWSSALADRVENRYLLLRAELLKRCGAWEG